MSNDTYPSGTCPACGFFCAGSEWDELNLDLHGLCGECFAALKELLDEGGENWESIDYEY